MGSSPRAGLSRSTGTRLAEAGVCTGCAFTFRGPESAPLMLIGWDSSSLSRTLSTGRPCVGRLMERR